MSTRVNSLSCGLDFVGYVPFDVARRVADRIRLLLKDRLRDSLVGVVPWCESPDRCVVKVLVARPEAVRTVAELLGLRIVDDSAEGVFEGVKVVVVVSRVGLLP